MDSRFHRIKCNLLSGTTKLELGFTKLALNQQQIRRWGSSKSNNRQQQQQQDAAPAASWLHQREDKKGKGASSGTRSGVTNVCCFGGSLMKEQQETVQEGIPQHVLYWKWDTVSREATIQRAADQLSWWEAEASVHTWLVKVMAGRHCALWRHHSPKKESSPNQSRW